MPFAQITRQTAERRAARRQSRQQFEIQALTSRFEGAQQQARAGFQAEQQGILQNFQQQMQQYGQELESYEAQVQRFQQASQDYNQAVDRFNTIRQLPGIHAVAGNPFGPSEGLTYVGGMQGAGNAAPSRSNLTADFIFDSVQRDPTTGLYFGRLSQRGGPDPGAFTAELGAAPQAPDTPTVENISQQYTESLERERQFFEREIGARRSASMRARRRIGARPLLSGE
jgi:hypothetical protein